MPSYDDVYNYLRSLGASHAHAAGAAINAGEESGFNPAAMGDTGTAHGLFQFREDRARGMKRVAGEDWQNNWKGQIDYAVSEPVFQEYLNTPFEGVNPAASWFTQYYERPAEKHARARNAKRGGMVSRDGQPQGSPSGPVTVSASQIAPGPAYQDGSVQPVSAEGPQMMQQPNIPPQPGIPQMPPIDPSMFEPEPMDRIRQGLGIMAQVLGGGRNVLGGAGLSNQMGGYGNYAAMLNLQMKAQDRQYKQQMQQWEKQRDQALIQSFPEEERGIAAIIGPTEYMKQKVMAGLEKEDLQLKQVIGPDGKPVFVREEDALGMEPYSTPLVSMGEKFGEPPGEGSSWLDPKAGKYQSPTGPNGEMQVQFLRGSEGWRKQKAFEAVPKRLTSSLDRLEAAVDKYGVTKLPSVAQGELQTTYASFILQAKEAEKLGALAGPDLDLIEGLIGNPTKWNQLKNKEVILRQIRVAREIMIERGIIEGSIDPGSVSTETPEQKADRIWDMP